MRIPWVLLIVTLALNIFVDVYLYNIADKRTKSPTLKRLQLLSSIVLYMLIVIALCLPRKSGGDSELITIMWLLFTYFSFYIAKYIFVLFDLLASIPRLFKRKRLKIVSIAGGVLALAVFFSMWWGALVNRFMIDVKQVDLEIKNLPRSFDGFTILQFSDFHVGTYGNDTAFVEKTVEKINSLNPDLIVFTGDIVNRRTSEISPFIEILSKLHSPYGVYSILGNHDYGDYSFWASDETKQANMDSLYRFNREMGWRLLRNEYEWIKSGNDSIAIIGVENIGDPPFPKYGSLRDAYPDLKDENVKILLSHNPAHWVDEISVDNSMNIDLTLSGHTHAMQIEVMGFSPAKYRYPTWGGLYKDEDSDRYLYVNIGLGTVGIPMRIGATPELTLITLHPSR